ncbi:THAP domain-containing protein 5-like [Stylophora pistillata]|uniref:THAP domain-containing protein 5-like n=1 Tax=Stylophora pistillata TaxID=50429 RepID=UPI000C0524F6|nr:THAP domain-containing protein 5-like [Stylophora pistillata]
MVYCFAPTCGHSSEGNTCKFFAFPSATKQNDEYKRWIRLIRREDREPSKYSRVCSCHFRNGQKANGPEVFERNKHKLFTEQRGPPPKKIKNTESKVESLSQMIEFARKNEQPLVADTEENLQTTQEIILEAELDFANRELKELNQTVQYKRNKYTVSALEGDVIRMETGLPTKEVFNIVVKHALRFKDSVNYFAGWKVESINFEDQIFITLMKVRQNYTQLHLAQLFHCSVATISNIVITFTHVLHEILKFVAAREENLQLP